jgi:hypothetical protein
MSIEVLGISGSPIKIVTQIGLLKQYWMQPDLNPNL